MVLKNYINSMFSIGVQNGFIEGFRGTLKAFHDHGPRLCQHQPVVSVKITDRTPMRTISDRYGWSLDDGYESDLPDYLWKALRPPPSDNPTKRGGWVSSGAADTGLSDACIVWARSQPLDD